MKPTVLSYKELDEQFVKDELAQWTTLSTKITKADAMVGKPALPHLKYGSKAQLTDEVVAQAEEDIKAELAAEGKPEKIWDKIIPGKMDRFFDNTKSWPSLHTSCTSLHHGWQQDSWSLPWISKRFQLSNSFALKLVKVLRKLQTTLKQKLQLQWQQL